MARVEVRKACKLHLSWLAGNLCQEDADEIYSQLAVEDPNYVALVAWETSPEWKFIAYLDDEPVLAFGLSVVHPTMCIAWAWGTKRKVRAFPEATRFMLETVKKQAIAGGIKRIQADSAEAHTNAHRWLKRLGAKVESEMPFFGKNGETFLKFVWINEE